SLVVLESLCHGCPVVAFEVNYGPADMIEDGENGALVPFDNEDLLAQRIIEILVNLCRSGSQWLLTTTFPGHRTGKDIAIGKWRPLNLEAEPFCLPPPLTLVVERCTQGNGRFADKSLGLWHLHDIANAIG
ncbi:MAG: glycosyltransferase, partial [Candidatus Paceibacterota bacterium]